MVPKPGSPRHETTGAHSVQGKPQEVVFMAESLTPREKEVLDLHDQGMRNVDIAASLQKPDGTTLSAGTVSNALVKALKKTGRDSEIGGGGGNGGRTATASTAAANDPQEMFKREGAKVLRRADETATAVETYPETFDAWLEGNKEALEKQYDADRERLISQAKIAEEASEKWVEFAERLDIDLTEIAAQGQDLPATPPEGETAEGEPTDEATTTEDDSGTDAPSDNDEASA